MNIFRQIKFCFASFNQAELDLTKPPPRRYSKYVNVIERKSSQLPKT